MSDSVDPMMRNLQANLRDEAMRWVIATSDRDFSGWEGLTRWLEQDPQHLAAYEAALERDQVMAEAVSQSERPVVAVARSRTSRGWWALGATGAIAAGLAIAILPKVLLRPAHFKIIETGNGEHKRANFADGSVVWLNGGTRIVLDGGSRTVTLERGEAMFKVLHDPARPFAVMVGDRRIVDVGTVFNVAFDGNALGVGVVEGAVAYQTGRGPVVVRQGNLLQVGSDGHITLSGASIEQIAGWSAGRLVFSDAPLGAVAAELTRTLGIPVEVEGAASRLRFTGSLNVRGDGDTAIRGAAALAGVTSERRANGWRWSE